MKTMKITKKAIKAYVKNQLGSNRDWALKGLVTIYQNQTADEKMSQGTIEYNGIGFSGADGEIMSSFSEQYRKWGRLSEKQLSIVLKKMPKYWQQIIQVSDKDKLELLVSKSLESQVKEQTAK